MKWLRLYDELLDDPKVQRLPHALFRDYINLLCLANRQKERGTLPDTPDVAFALRTSPEQAVAALGMLAAAGLLDVSDDGVRIHGWDERQYTSDTPEAAAERKRRQRDRERERHSDLYMEGHAGVTVTDRDSHSIVTPPEQIQNRTDTEADTEQSSSAPQADAPTRSVPKPPKGTRLTEPYVPDEDDQKWVRTVAPELYWQYETEKFNDYWSSQPGQKGVKTNWRGTWRNWMRSAWERVPQSNGKTRLQAVPQPRSPDEVLEEQRARDREDAEWRASKVRDGKADRLCIQRHKQDVERGVYPRLEVQA